MPPTSLLQDFVDELNARVFFKEFSFAGALIPVATGELELADQFVLIDDLAIVYQLKERSNTASADPHAVTKWFESKVLKSAKSQIKNSIQALRAMAGATVRNQRGHTRTLPKQPPSEIHSVIVFRSPLTPDAQPYQHLYVSEDVGPIHIFHDADYFGVCRYLVTPHEIARYLGFRARVLSDHEWQDEPALVAQFMLNELDVPPSDRFRAALGAYHDDWKDWDLSVLFSEFGDHVEPIDAPLLASTGSDYYPILTELAKLSRSELRELKMRLMIGVEHARSANIEPPLRVSFPRTNCGFLILGVPQEHWSGIQKGLMNFSIGSQYELKVPRHIGVGIGARGHDLDLVWFYREREYEYDEVLERKLVESNPFRPVRQVQMPVYKFNEERLRAAGFTKPKVFDP